MKILLMIIVLFTVTFTNASDDSTNQVETRQKTPKKTEYVTKHMNDFPQMTWSYLPNCLDYTSDTAGAFVNGKFYQICGNPFLEPAGHAQIWDGTSWSWSICSHPDGSVEEFSVTVWNNKIVCSAGAHPMAPYFNYTTLYDPEAETWTVDTPNTILGIRSTSMACVGDKCYQFGGVSSYIVRANVFFWTPGDSVMGVRTDMPEPRHSAAAAVWNDKIYVFGGNMSDVWTYPTNNIWEYDPEANSWTVKSATLQTPRCKHTAVTIGDKIYIVGGLGPSPLDSTEIYDPVSDTIIYGTPMLMGRYGHASAGNYMQFGNHTYVGWLYVSGGTPSSLIAQLATIQNVTFYNVQPTSLGNIKAIYH